MIKREKNTCLFLVPKITQRILHPHLWRSYTEGRLASAITPANKNKKHSHPRPGAEVRTCISDICSVYKVQSKVMSERKSELLRSISF
ncbi:hypothetical protein PR048_010642 [Dryococelus australis]|uniref:Uncharacterized protein n=1 Tax=Dryococelus australis TaxID=614101 RepID=A0ABQ9I5A4_9NEOP|nr:hypothetical protein PR048_010642 [Dryococelus australis]